MSDWTPTTEQVRDGYRYDPEEEWRNPGSNAHITNGYAFDRWLRQHDSEVLAPLEELNRNLSEQFDRDSRKITELDGAVKRVRALADMWASEVSSDEQDYVTAAKYRAVARDLYEALDGDHEDH